jgi:ABC-type amino acid transport substrate-binding protein
MALYNPFVVHNPKTAELDGFIVDDAKYLAEQMGLKLEISELTWDSLIAALQTRKVDIIMCSTAVTMQRSLAVAFSQPYGRVGVVMAVQKGATWESIDQPGNIVAMAAGVAAVPMVKQTLKNAKLETYTEESNAFLEFLKRKNVVAFSTDFIAVSLHMAALSEDNRAKLDIIAHPTWHERPHAYMLHQGDQDWLNFINSYVTRGQVTGRYAKLCKKWGLDPNKYLWWTKKYEY